METTTLRSSHDIVRYFFVIPTLPLKLKLTKILYVLKINV